MPEANLKSAYFGYPASQNIMGLVLMPLLTAACLGLGILLFSMHSIFVGVILIAISLWFANLVVFGSLMRSSIVVSDDRIGTRYVGQNLKSVRWPDVAKIKKVSRWNPASKTYDAVFYIFDGDYGALRERMVNLRGPIVFTDKINRLRELLDEINKHAQRYRFPLVVLDQEAARTRASQLGAGVWARTVPKVEEVAVSAF